MKLKRIRPSVYRYLIISLLSLFSFVSCQISESEIFHVWEKIEITLVAEKNYPNPYTDVLVWVELKGPEFQKKCYGFWDGGQIYKVRVLANTSGEWTWESGSNQSDNGLNGLKGNFSAVTWNESEKSENPNRRGMVKSTSNGHAFEYADGTPYFMLGDTWWAAGTYRYPWYEDDIDREIGPDAGFKDYVKYRADQEYNCIALVAGFPNWANDELPNESETEEGIILRDAWLQAGTTSAKSMHDEDGNRIFKFPGSVPGYEDYFPDVNRINPEYFQKLDKKVDFFNSLGFIPFIEVARRDIGPAWRKYYKWPETYSRYIQYIWSRYQANICFFSPIHFDWDGSLPADEWNLAANEVIDTFGPPPFGTMVSCNPTGSSLENFGHIDKAKWINFHQIGNFHHEFEHGHRSYPLLTDMFEPIPPLPAINGEPYYDGQHGTNPGSDEAGLYSRSAMYGSFLSGGYGGHIYGAGKEGEEGGGMWGGNIEDEANFKIWDALLWESGNQMKYFKDFVLSEGIKYVELYPSADLLIPANSKNDNDWLSWSYCSSTKEKDLVLVYFEKNCKNSTVQGLVPDTVYKLHWFDPRNGTWLEDKTEKIKTDPKGKIVLPEFPDGSSISRTDWALKLLLN